MSTVLHCGDSLAVLKSLPSESVQCCVTSPPYWGLRNYNVAGQLGLERTPAEYILKTVEIFRQVRRVLRRDGTLWLNMGDCYATDGRKVGRYPGGGKQGENWGVRGVMTSPNRMPLPGMKAKDMVGMPWRLAFALQDDGWYLRRDIVWAKKTPMPESVRDRPTTAHEYVFLLTKRQHYFYDYVAVMEPATSSHGSGNKSRVVPRDGQRSRTNTHMGISFPWEHSFVRNLRSVWTIASQPYKGAHFATFPEKLAMPCILAGTSEKGCCSFCGAPLKRVVERQFVGDWHPNKERGHDASVPASTALMVRDYKHSPGAVAQTAKWAKGPAIVARNGQPEHRGAAAAGVNHDHQMPPPKTIGWERSCKCTLTKETEPCTVLDPFSGSGTVGVVCEKFGRNFIGIDLSQEYCDMAWARIEAARKAAEGLAV